MTPERLAELRLYAEGIARHAGGAELRKILWECILEIERLQELDRQREEIMLGDG